MSTYAFLASSARLVIAGMVILSSLLAPRSSWGLPLSYQLRLEATTDFPASLGGRLSAEFPYRLRLSTSLGFLPGPYVDAINGIVVGLGGYNQATADVIRAALQNSLIWRTHVGWRPLARFGFYIETGYGLVALGGSATGEQIVAAATGRAMPSSGGRSYSVNSTLHMIDVELGWEWALLHRRLSLRVGVGGAFTVGASTGVKPAFKPVTPLDAWLVQGFASLAGLYLDNTYRSYVHTPIITVGAGYRFY